MPAQGRRKPLLRAGVVSRFLWQAGEDELQAPHMPVNVQALSRSAELIPGVDVMLALDDLLGSDALN